MEIAGLCLPLKPQKEKCTVYSLPSAYYCWSTGIKPGTNQQAQRLKYF